MMKTVEISLMTRALRELGVSTNLLIRIWLVMLSEMVGYSYALCAIIYSSYKRLCQDVEEVIMNRIDDQEERVEKILLTVIRQQRR